MVRIRLVLSIVGIVLQGFSATLAIPVLAALLLEDLNSMGILVLCMLTALMVGRVFQRLHPSDSFDDLTRLEGMASVALSWLTVAIVGAIPYVAFNLGIINSLFESMSGFTTTGATILSDFSVLSSSIFFYRGYTQWLGGMGILVLFVAILPHLAISGRQLFYAETSSATKDKLTPRISDTAKRLWGWYFFLTVVQSLALMYFGMSTVDALANSFTTMAAGGFSPHPESIMGYQSAAVEWVIIFFMFLAGANFTLQYKVARGDVAVFLKNPELRMYALIIAVTTLVLSILLCISPQEPMTVIDSLRTSLFQNLSILTTTGFATVDFELWQESAKVVLLVLMFIGGCSGSAGGGIKVIRLLLVLKYIGKNLVNAVYPNAVISLKLGDRAFKETDIQPVFSFVVLYFLIFALGGTIAAIIESDIIVGYTGAIATLGNIGPGFGLIGPMGSYDGLHEVTRMIYFFLMWVGRLELMSVAVFFRPESWSECRW